MKRRSCGEIETAIVAALKKFGVCGASISEIAIEAKTNWRTSRDFIERLYNWDMVTIVKQKKKLKIYKWKH